MPALRAAPMSRQCGFARYYSPIAPICCCCCHNLGPHGAKLKCNTKLMPRYTTVLTEVTNAVTEVAYTGLPTSSEFTWTASQELAYDPTIFCVQGNSRIFTKSAKSFNTFTTKCDQFGEECQRIAWVI